MAEPYIWAGLERANNDPTTIDEAIGEAIAAHNDDPDAHVGPEQSLESHRASEIIDHRAESIVNDKIKASTRAFVAIVDPASEYDFDTIEAACEYADNVGGGTILVMPGNHYLSGKLELPATVNLYGIDADTTIIHTDYDDGKYIVIKDGSLKPTDTLVIESLTFETHSPYAFEGYDGGEYEYNSLEFLNCNFKGVGGYYRYASWTSSFTNCTFFLTTNAALITWGRCSMLRCHFRTSAISGVLVLFDSSADTETIYCSITNCDSLFPYGVSVRYFKGYGFGNIKIFGCRLGSWNSSIIELEQSNFTGNDLICYGSNYFNLDGSRTVLEGNLFYGESGNTLRLTSNTSKCIVANNIVGTAITNSGTGNLLSNNVVT